MSFIIITNRQHPLSIIMLATILILATCLATKQVVQAKSEFNDGSAGGARSSGEGSAELPDGLAPMLGLGKAGLAAVGVGGVAGELGAGLEKKETEKKEAAVTAGELDIFKNPGELIKSLLNPIELVKAICAKYKLHSGKFIELVGKPLLFGMEAALSPFTITIKIIEKVFVPDSCRLHFICKIGSNISFIKDHIPKFSSNFGEGSSLIKAFGEGLLGEECASKFVCESGEPKLKKEYEGLKL